MSEQFLARKVLELEDENRRLRCRLTMLAETVALLSVPPAGVSEGQFSLLAFTGREQ